MDNGGTDDHRRLRKIQKWTKKGERYHKNKDIPTATNAFTKAHAHALGLTNNGEATVRECSINLGLIKLQSDRVNVIKEGLSLCKRARPTTHEDGRTNRVQYGNVYRQMALGYGKLNGKTEKVFQYLRMASEEYSKDRDDELVIDCYKAILDILLNKDQPTSLPESSEGRTSADYINKELKRMFNSEAATRGPDWPYYNCGLLLNDLGLLYYQLKLYGKAFDVFEWSDKIVRKSPQFTDHVSHPGTKCTDKTCTVYVTAAALLGWICTNIGNVYQRKKEVEKAEEYYRQAIDDFGKIDYKKGQGQVYFNSAISCIMSGQESLWPRAELALKMALQFGKDTDDHETVTECLETMGDMFHEQRNYRESRNNYMEALKGSFLKDTTRNRLVEKVTKTRDGIPYPTIRSNSAHIGALPYWPNYDLTSGGTSFKHSGCESDDSSTDNSQPPSLAGSSSFDSGDDTDDLDEVFQQEKVQDEYRNIINLQSRNNTIRTSSPTDAIPPTHSRRTSSPGPIQTNGSRRRSTPEPLQTRRSSSSIPTSCQCALGDRVHCGYCTLTTPTPRTPRPPRDTPPSTPITNYMVPLVDPEVTTTKVLFRTF